MGVHTKVGGSPQEGFFVCILKFYLLIFVLQNSHSGTNSSVESVESTIRSVPAVPCCVRKEGRKEREKEKEVERKNERKRTKGESTRNGSREWASDCEARSHEHEDVRELHLDDSMKSVGVRSFLRLLYRLWKNK